MFEVIRMVVGGEVWLGEGSMSFDGLWIRWLGSKPVIDHVVLSAVWVEKSRFVGGGIRELRGSKTTSPAFER